MLQSQKQIESFIEEANRKYREGSPIIDDAGYDALLDQLRLNYPESFLLKKGVIEKAGKTSRKEQLPIPMFSLEKCKSLDEIKAWAKAKGIKQHEKLILTPKYDGISLVVDESNKHCWTRGDGEVGQNSKWHFNKLRGSNNDLCEMFTFGEAIMPKKAFIKYSEEFANARNFVAGLFNRDITTMPLQEVDYIRYGSDQNGVDKSEQLSDLNRMNVIFVPSCPTSLNLLTEEKLDDLYKLWSADYKIDGIVIDVDDADKREELGREENMNPAYAVAYKNPEWSGSAVVTVTGITWQVSKQGKLKPVIQIAPTEVGEVMISNITGYNAAYIIDQKIAIDSVIKIIRSGDVIPKHIETISSDRNQREMLMDEIATCPCCDHQTCWDETKVELVCTNPECRDKKIAKLTHFFATLEIEEFGEPSIIRLYNAGFDTIEKILNLDVEELLLVEGFGIKSSASLLNQFETLKSTGKPYAQILDSLDVMAGKLGQKTIQLILDNCWGKSFDIEDMIKINGVAETTALIFRAGWYRGEKFSELPVKISYIETPKVVATGDKYASQKICFTGCRPTKEQEQEIKQQGGEVVSGVSKNTTLLVVKDNSEKTMSSNKAVEAKKLGISVITINNL